MVHRKPTKPEPDDGQTLSEPKRHLGKSLDFIRLIWELHHVFGSASKQMKQQIGVTGLQRLTIRIVGRFPGISAGDVAQILHVHPSTLTGVFQKLQRKGMIARGADPADSRRSILLLTAHGRRVDRSKERTVEESVRRALVRIPEAKIETTMEVLAALIGDVKEDWPFVRRVGRRSAPSRRKP